MEDGVSFRKRDKNKVTESCNVTEKPFRTKSQSLYTMNLGFNLDFKLLNFSNYKTRTSELLSVRLSRCIIQINGVIFQIHGCRLDLFHVFQSCSQVRTNVSLLNQKLIRVIQGQKHTKYTFISPVFWFMAKHLQNQTHSHLLQLYFVFNANQQHFSLLK